MNTPSCTTSKTEQDLISDLAYYTGQRLQVERDIEYTRVLAPGSSFVRIKTVTLSALKSKIADIEKALVKLNPEKWK